MMSEEVMDEVEYDACVHPHTNDHLAIDEIAVQRQEWSRFMEKNSTESTGMY